MNIENNINPNVRKNMENQDSESQKTKEKLQEGIEENKNENQEFSKDLEKIQEHVMEEFETLEKEINEFWNDNKPEIYKEDTEEKEKLNNTIKDLESKVDNFKDKINNMPKTKEQQELKSKITTRLVQNIDQIKNLINKK